ncbi:hypothetical protein ACH4UT_33230, partial [Streptomyces sp. NPDC020799]|uniref:hypothetical protein n=1 Tax=Streptomyces sp. NPDC020799 TaxID=3365091 RepID=UPI0037902DC8
MLSTSQPRRMALVPLPMPGESFASWLDAVARDNGCGQDAILIRGWKVRTNPVSSINRLNMSLTGKEIRHISAATGMAHDDLAALCMRVLQDFRDRVTAGDVVMRAGRGGGVDGARLV